MVTLLIAVGAGLAFIAAYHTYGRWLGGKIFRVSADAVCPSRRLRDDTDYVPTPKSVVFGHHFTSIAGTGPIVGPAIAVMWGWLPALLWVVLGSVFIGAVHDFGSLIVSLRNNGQTVGDIAGRVLNRRVRVLFLLVLFLALTIIIAIFGLVIAAVFRQYPAAIFPCMVQIPIAVGIGVWLHRRGVGLLWPSLLALGVMYLSVWYGNAGWLGAVNGWMASWPTIVWVAVLLAYSYVASVLPVWSLLQPRDYINALQLITALGLVVVGLCVAAAIGGAAPVAGAARQPLHVVAPMVNLHPPGAPAMLPFLFITIACGAISGFHCLVSSGTSSKQLKTEADARFVGYGAMLTEGFLAVIVILACVAGLGLGTTQKTQFAIHTNAKGEDDGVTALLHGQGANSYAVSWGPGFLTFDQLGGGSVKMHRDLTPRKTRLEDVGSQPRVLTDHGIYLPKSLPTLSDLGLADVPNGWEKPFHSSPWTLAGATAFNARYQSWTAAGSLGAKVGAFVDGSANFLAAMGIPLPIAVALMGVLVASFAGTTLDTSCRLQRYVVQELAATVAPVVSATACAACGYDLSFNVSGACPECGKPIDNPPPLREGLGEGARAEGAQPGTGDTPHPHPASPSRGRGSERYRMTANPITWLTNKHAATIFAVVLGGAMAALPGPGMDWTWANTGTGGLILWPMFGATNQLLAGLAFLVIGFYLWRRGLPVWFMALPMVFMLIMPAWAMSDQFAGWWHDGRYLLLALGAATVALEAWMVVEAALLWPKVKGVLEAHAGGQAALPGA